MFLQICVSSFWCEEENGLQYPCMGMPDLITLEQFVVSNGTQRISGKTLEASSIKNKKEEAFQ